MEKELLAEKEKIEKELLKKKEEIESKLKDLDKGE